MQSGVMPLSQFGQTFRPLPPAGPLPADLSRQIGMVLLAGVRKRFQAGVSPSGVKWKPLGRARPGGGGGSLPLLDTGVLRNSFQVRVEADGASVGSVLPQARLHQYGGIVRPKRAKNLSIPLTAMAKRAGSPRRFPRKLEFRPFKTKGANAVGVLYERKGSAQVDHYLLVKEVAVPARPIIGESAEDSRLIQRIVSEYGYRIATNGLG